jgi:predicted esterase
VGENPYRRIGDGNAEKIVAKFVPAKKPSAKKELIVMLHCYGVPLPKVMERLFGLHAIEHADVVYNIMNHHYRGSFPVWPGTGFVSGRLSHFIENLRSSITGVRALIQELKDQRGYDKITVIGFSIGGNLALHVANSAPIDQAILYCPVTSLHNTAGELGLMKVLQAPVTRLIQAFKPDFDFEDLKQADPLRYPLGIQQEDLHVIVQKYDALAPVHQIESIRSKYPKVAWHEFGGTHIYPAGMPRFQKVIADVLTPPRH